MYIYYCGGGGGGGGVMSEWVCVHGRVLDLGSTGGVCMGAGQCTVCARICV